MKINDTLKNALSEAINEAGGQSAFARLTGVNRQNIFRYMAGYSKTVTPDVYKRIQPYLLKYLPEGASGIHGSGRIVIRSYITDGNGDNERDCVKTVYENGTCKAEFIASNGIRYLIEFPAEYYQALSEMSDMSKAELFKEIELITVAKLKI